MVVHLQPAVNLSDEQFFNLCQVNRDLRIERNEYGELIIMPPTGGDTGDRESEINMQLRIWAKRDGTGKAFGSSTGFTLPNGAVRSPDVAWLPLSRWKALTAKQRKKFVPLCPDFVVELRSPTIASSRFRRKCRNILRMAPRWGCWSIPKRNESTFTGGIEGPAFLRTRKTVSCDPVLPGFVLDLREIW